jgi:hypothetical protein
MGIPLLPWMISTWVRNIPSVRASRGTSKSQAAQSMGQGGVGEVSKEFDDTCVDLVSIHTAAFYPGIREMFASLVEGHDEHGQAVIYGTLSNACGTYVGISALQRPSRSASSSGRTTFRDPSPSPTAYFTAVQSFISHQSCVCTLATPQQMGRRRGLPACLL